MDINLYIISYRCLHFKPHTLYIVLVVNIYMMLTLTFHFLQYLRIISIDLHVRVHVLNQNIDVDER